MEGAEGGSAMFQVRVLGKSLQPAVKVSTSRKAEHKPGHSVWASGRRWGRRGGGQGLTSHRAAPNEGLCNSDTSLFRGDFV